MPPPNLGLLLDATVQATQPAHDRLDRVRAADVKRLAEVERAQLVGEDDRVLTLLSMTTALKRVESPSLDEALSRVLRKAPGWSALREVPSLRASKCRSAAAAGPRPRRVLHMAASCRGSAS